MLNRRKGGIAVAACVGIVAGLGGWALGSQAISQTPLVHVVLFDLKDDAPASAAEALVADAHAMLAKIPVVSEVRAGRRAPGDRDVHVKDYDVGLYLHLKTASDVPAYLEHPLHVQFAEKHGATVERVRVCDFYDE
jgi:hypothetical protein